MPHTRLTPLALCGLTFVLSGCAAPLKSLMQSGQPDLSVVVAPAGETDPAREALRRKAEALLRAKEAEVAEATKPLSAENRPARARSAEPEPERQDAVRAMLTRARQAPNSAQVAQPAPPGELARQFRVKSEARLTVADPGTTAALPQTAGGALIRFRGQDSTLDPDGNRILAKVTERSGLDPSYRMVLVAGLAGPGEAWERMRLAAARLETVANHVPPPLRVERRYDPALGIHEMRIELAGGAR